MKKCMFIFNSIFICVALNASDQKELSTHNYKLFCAIKTIKNKAEEAARDALGGGIKATTKISDFPSFLEDQTQDGLVLAISNKIEIVSPWGKIPLAVNFFGRDAQKLKDTIQSNIFSIVRVDARKQQPYPQVATKYKVLAVDGHPIPKEKSFNFSCRTDAKENIELWRALDKRYKKEQLVAKL